MHHKVFQRFVKGKAVPVYLHLENVLTAEELKNARRRQPTATYPCRRRSGRPDSEWNWNARTSPASVPSQRFVHKVV